MQATPSFCTQPSQPTANYKKFPEESAPREIFVGVTGFEPATPWSQTRCATNCATPRNQLFTLLFPTA